MNLTLVVALSVVYALAFAFLALQAIWRLEKQRIEWQVECDKQRSEWREERNKLLDRIQAGSFIEFKAQERAETPIKRKEKDPLTAKLEGEPWL